MENILVFTYFRPVFMLFIFTLSTLCLLLLNKRFRADHKLLAVSISFLSLLVSGMLLFIEGVIVDELKLSGDARTFYMFVIIACLFTANVFFSFYERKRLI
jgi:hypothetical protein